MFSILKGSQRKQDREATKNTGSCDQECLLCAKSLQLCPAICDPMDHSPPDFSVHGILQARILEWIAMPSSKGSNLGLMSPALRGGFFTRMSGDQESMAQVRRHMPITVPKREVSRVTLPKILLCDQEQEGIFLQRF